MAATDKKTTTQILNRIKSWVLLRIADITELIPSAASALNQLADKAFVNSSIATATATFRGTYNLVSDLSLTTSATQEQIAAALATKMSALSITPDNNDYCFVQIPTADATPTQIARIDKYKFNGTAWSFEYSLNNSGFTSAQWAAINSGATLELIGKLSALPTNAELTNLLNAKANKSEMSFTDGTGANADKTTIQLKTGTSKQVLISHIPQDNAPTENSNNNVKSGGVHTALVNTVAGSGVFDLSVHNAVNGVPATYANLSAAITALNALPAAYKKGGMSFKFVRSSDNKYVQYRYMGTETTGNPNPFLDEANWQCVEEQVRGLENRVKDLENESKILVEYGNIKVDGTPSTKQFLNRVRFKYYYRDFTIVLNDGFIVNEAYYYDSSENFINSEIIGTDDDFTYSGNGFVKLVFKKSDNSNISDIDEIIKYNFLKETGVVFSTANTALSTANTAQNTAANTASTLEKEVLGGDFVIEMEYGNIGVDGVPSANSYPNRSRTKNFISGNFYVKVDTDFTLYEVYLYNQDETFDRVIYMSSGNREYTGDGTKLVKFCVKRNDNANISDVSLEIIKSTYLHTIKNDVDYLMNNMATFSDFYEFTKQYERNRTLKDFIPYSVRVTNGSQTNRLNLLFFTDNHIDLSNPVQSLDNVKDTVTFLNNSGISFDAVLNGGDAITPFGRKTKAEEKLVFKKFADEIKKFSNVPVLFTKGNHDTNNWQNTPANTFDDADWGDMWFDYAETTYGMVRQTKSNSQKSTWGYIDIASKKVRIIVLDNQDVDNSIAKDNGDVLYFGGVAWYISNEQFNWVMNTALNFDDKTEKDWGVIVLSHQEWRYGVQVTADNWVGGTPYSVGAIVTYDNNVYRCTTANSDSVFNSSKWALVNPEGDMSKFKNALVAFKNYTTYQESYSFSGDSFYDLSINADFTRYANLDKKPYFICWLVGHDHADKYNVTDGIITIWTLNGSATTLASDTKMARVLGTPTQNAFDLLSIDLVDKKIRIVRYGAGVNCNGEGGNRFLPDGLSF